MLLPALQTLAPFMSPAPTRRVAGNTITAIALDGTSQDFAVESGPTPAMYASPVIAPAGTPNAGTVYLNNQGASYDGKTVATIEPNGTTSLIAVGSAPEHPVIAPAGTPNAGTVYVSNLGSANADGNTVTAIATDGTTKTITVGKGPTPGVIAPAGTTNAGMVYISNTGSKTSDGETITVIKPDGTTTTVKAGTRPVSGVIAPAGTPNAGTLYVPDAGSAAPGASGVGTFVTVVSPAGESTNIAVSGGGVPSATPLVAPAGAANAGTVYFILSRTIAVLKPDGTVDRIQVLPTDAVGLGSAAVAPADAPNAGYVYAVNSSRDSDSTLVVIKPDGSSTTDSSG